MRSAIILIILISVSLVSAQHSYKSGYAVPAKTVALKTGIKMQYVEQGGPSGIPLIFVHGFTDSSFSYSRVIPLLDKRKYHVYAIDQRGHGGSDKPQTGYAITDLAADIVAFMDALSIKKATIVGHSMGSFVAMQTAVSAPDRVERLVLIGTATTANNDVVRELRRAVLDLNEPVPAAFIREFQTGTIYRTLPDDFLNGILRESGKLPVHVWKGALSGVIATKIADDLHRITVPTLVIWGDKETVFPRSEQDLLVSKLQNATLKIYPDAGHSPNWEYPEMFARDLNEFLAKQN